MASFQDVGVGASAARAKPTMPRPIATKEIAVSVLPRSGIRTSSVILIGVILSDGVSGAARAGDIFIYDQADIVR
jgi:hypothetical protein